MATAVLMLICFVLGAMFGEFRCKQGHRKKNIVEEE